MSVSAQRIWCQIDNKTDLYTSLTRIQHELPSKVNVGGLNHSEIFFPCCGKSQEGNATLGPSFNIIFPNMREGKNSVTNSTVVEYIGLDYDLSCCNEVFKALCQAVSVCGTGL